MGHSYGGTGRTLAAYRGSRKRLRRIRMRGNANLGVWVLLILALLMLFVGIPWLMHHPPPHREHVFGVSQGPGHK
jgi:uncharacterized iron-regulated membrane protein